MITTEKARNLAVASDASYGTTEVPRSIPQMIENGYTVVRPINDPDTGFNAVVFRKNGTDDYVVAMTGTEGTQDGVADLALGTGNREIGKSESDQGKSLILQ
jgi:hypothetical protein